MANFRNFTLYNYSREDSIGLNSFDGYLVTTPTGVGVYFKNSYFDIGSKRIRTDQRSAYRSITMIVDIFASTRNGIEEKYSALRDFISKYRLGGFKLGYKPYDGAQERYIECDIKDLDKSEKSTRSIMSIPLTIEPRTMWRIDEQSIGAVQNDESGNKWSFDLDDNFDGLTKYDVLMEGQVGEQEVQILGYDKHNLPDGFVFNLRILDGVTGRVYEGSISLGDCEKTADGVYIGKSIVYDSMNTSTSGWRICAVVTINLNNGTMKLKAIKEEITSDNNATVSYTLDKDYDFSVFNFTFTNAEDVALEKRVTVEYRDNIPMLAGQYLNGNVYCPAGQKYCHLTISKYRTLHSITATRYYVVQSGSDADFTWSASGEVYVGTQNYMEGFLFDEGVTLAVGSNYYDIAMFRGATSMNEFTNDSDVEIPLKVRIFGLAANPSVRLIPVGGTTAIQTTRVNVNIPEGAYVEIDSDPENTGAWIHYANGTVASVLTYLDQNTNMFLTLPQGSFFIQVADDNDNAVITNVIYKKEYVGA